MPSPDPADIDVVTQQVTAVPDNHHAIAMLSNATLSLLHAASPHLHREESVSAAIRSINTAVEAIRRDHGISHQETW